MADPGPGEYRCALCGQVFKTGWSDEEARAELAERFPGTGTEECVVICDGCNELLELTAQVVQGRSGTRH